MKSFQDFRINIWRIYVHCDVLVVRYWLGLLSQAANILNLSFWTVPHLIRKPYSSYYTPPPCHIFWILPFHFHPSLCVPYPWPWPTSSTSTFFHFLPLPDPTPLMPERPGPWALDKVKRRLRREQVAREQRAGSRQQAASARYRQEEEAPRSSLKTGMMHVCMYVYRYSIHAFCNLMSLHHKLFISLHITYIHHAIIQIQHKT